ncbi:MAG: hypothetical protein WCI51_19855, partial [Lentisphaerota bacterium]
MKRLFFYLAILAVAFLIQSELFADPLSPAYNIIFSSVTKTSMKIGVTKGNGDGRLVVRYDAATAISPTAPTTGSTYIAGNTIGSGANMGTVIANLTNPNWKTSATGLTAGKTYKIIVYEYNSALNYNTPTDFTNPRNVKTVPEPPTNLYVDPCTGVGPTWFTATWVKPVDGKDGFYLRVSTDNGFSSLVDMYEPAEVDTTTSLMIDGLSNNTDYYWSMKTYYGNRTSSDTVYGTNA